MWYKGFKLVPSKEYGWILVFNGKPHATGTLFQCKIYIDHIVRYKIDLGYGKYIYHAS